MFRVDPLSGFAVLRVVCSHLFIFISPLHFLPYSYCYGLKNSVTKYGLSAQRTQKPVLWHQLLRQGFIVRLTRKEIGGKAQTCLLDPGFGTGEF